jgi:hypothetical protein
VLQNLEPRKHSEKNTMKMTSKNKHCFNLTQTFPVRKSTDLNNFFDKSKKYIDNKLSLEYIIKQFYFLENYVKSFVDKNIGKELIFDMSQKIPYKVIDPSIINENDSFPKSLVMKIEINKEAGIDQSQSILQCINEK